jgi:hypothetical protein
MMPPPLAPPVPVTCRAIAAALFAAAQRAHAEGDDRRGDHLNAKSLYWEMAAETGAWPDE